MGNDGQAASGVRLTELLAALSLGTDLGMGHPMEHVLRQSIIAIGLARRAGLDAAEREAVFYSSMLAWVGCHVDAYEQAKWFGDDQALKRDARYVDLAQPIERTGYVLRHLGAGKPVLQRVALATTFMGEGRRAMLEMFGNHSRTSDALTERLGFDDDVRRSVQQSFERWDGKGDPDGLAGAEIELGSRLVNLADVVEVFHRAGGVDAAVAVARQRSGTQFDPGLVELFCDSAKELLDELDDIASWTEVMVTEPRLQRELSEDELDSALEAVADFVDLKSPYTLGHSRGVADLVGQAASDLGLGDADGTNVRRAALAHDLGRLGVSNAIWDKAGDLSQAEAERVRMHPYLTERMLASAPGLQPLAALAVQHHERMDGSGYPRGLAAGSLSAGGRLLAAADTYQTKSEPRPHRPALAPDDTASVLRAQAREGRLDGDAVEAVLGAAGHRVRRRREWPAGLTGREVEVLRLVARGMSHKQIAEQLVISRKTASNHVEHIYTKIDASNRAQASLFAVSHGLMVEVA